MSNLQLKNILSVLDDYDAFLFDLWGVIVEGGQIYPGVVDTINKISEQKKVFFVSNAPRPKSIALGRLKSWGLNTSAEMIYTSGEIAREMMLSTKESFGIDKSVIYHLGADRNADILSDIDLKITTNIEEANIILLTLHREDGENLDEFDDILKIVADKKIITICANPDTSVVNLGSISYCAGFFARKLEQMGGRVIYTGKPHSIIYDQVIASIPEISKDRILMIGDTYDTDILGANKAGIHSSLVMTGNAASIHSAAAEIEDKLLHLHEAALKAGAMPTFITKLAL